MVCWVVERRLRFEEELHSTETVASDLVDDDTMMMNSTINI
jgi:hypothetical protein